MATSQSDNDSVQESNVWQRARQLASDQLVRNGREELGSDELHETKLDVHVVKTICDDAQLVCKKITGNRHRVVKKLARVIETLEKHGKAIDVLVQPEPIAAFAWGCVRIVIRITDDLLRSDEKIAAAIPGLIDGISQCQLVLGSFISFERVREAIANLLGASLCVLVEIRRQRQPQQQHSFSLTILKKKLSQGALGRYLLNVDAATYRLEIEMRTASAQKQEALYVLAREKASDQESFRTAQNQVNEIMNEKIDSLRQAGLDRSRMRRFEKLKKWLNRDFQVVNDQGEPSPGTCGWLQETSEWNLWSSSGRSGCFHITGPEGCGKTNIARFLEKSMAQDVVVLRYSFSVTNRSTAPVLSQLFVSLLRRMVAKYSDSHQIPVFEQAVEQCISLVDRSDSFAGIHSKTLLLKSMLHTFLDSIDDFLLIVDGVGEEGEMKEREVDHCWIPLFNYLEHLALQRNSRVIVLSRSGSIPEGVLGDSTRLEISTAMVTPDVERFLEDQINRSRNPALQQKRTLVVREILQKCESNFLVASLMVNQLNRCKTSNSIKNNMGRLPSRLESLYSDRLALLRASLTEDELSSQRDIFRIVLGSRRILSVTSLGQILAHDCSSDQTNEDDVHTMLAHTIWSLCSPFVNVVGGQVQFWHASAREYLKKKDSPGDPDEFLARKTLSKLNEPDCRKWQFAAQLLRQNLPTGVVEQHRKTHRGDSGFYEYACLNWTDHLIALSSPPDDILSKLRDFLRGNQFVSWSETIFQLKQNTSNGTQVQVKERLTAWVDQLAPDLGSQIPLDDYYVKAHENISVEFARESGDNILEYLPLVRLGTFFNVSGKTEMDFLKGFNYKMKVEAGYREILGENHPTTLRAKAMVLKEYFWQKRYDEAETGFQQVAEAQRAQVGENSLDFLSSLQLCGLSQLYVTKFSCALDTLATASEGYLRVLDRENINGLVTRMYIGHTLERLARYGDAYQEYSNILTVWLVIGGEQHPFTLMLKTALGSASRQLGRYEKAATLLLDALTIRQRLFSSNNNVYVDSVIQLTATYYSWGKGKESKEYLDLISDSDSLESDFERKCQATHIRALVDIMCNQSERAKQSLQAILIDSTNNRELLWIRITLADLYRREGDEDQALILFHDLVVSIAEEASLWGIGELDLADRADNEILTLIESPAQLRIAEEALRLVKNAKFQEADRLLEKNGLGWKCNKDFWVINGGPITDTASISGLDSRPEAHDFPYPVT